jgi:hypothetical protein
MKFTVLSLLMIAAVMFTYFGLHTKSFKTVPVIEKPIYGQVTAKEWVPAHTSTWFMTTTVGDITMMTPMTDHIPDLYHLKVAGRVIQVTKEVFEKTQIGDMYGTPPEAEK